MQQRLQQPGRLPLSGYTATRPPTSGNDLYRLSRLEFASKGTAGMTPRLTTLINKG